jgi:hypothetical protein
MVGERERMTLKGLPAPVVGAEERSDEDATAAVQDETLGVRYWEMMTPPSAPRAEVSRSALAEAAKTVSIGFSALAA